MRIEPVAGLPCARSQKQKPGRCRRAVPRRPCVAERRWRPEGRHDRMPRPRAWKPASFLHFQPVGAWCVAARSGSRTCPACATVTTPALKFACPQPAGENWTNLPARRVCQKPIWSGSASNGCCRTHAVDAPNPARQMALIRKTRFCGNLGKAEFSIPNHFDRASQSQMNDVAMQRSGPATRTRHGSTAPAATRLPGPPATRVPPHLGILGNAGCGRSCRR